MPIAIGTILIFSLFANNVRTACLGPKAMLKMPTSSINYYELHSRMVDNCLAAARCQGSKLYNP